MSGIIQSTRNRFDAPARLEPRHCAACLVRIGYTSTEAAHRTGVSKTAAQRAAARFTDILTRIPDRRLYCVDCLLRIGTGMNLAVRLSGVAKATIKRYRDRKGYRRAQRPTLNLGKRMRTEDRAWQEQAWADEWRGVRYLGELQHWARHPAITDGLSPAMFAYYADVGRARRRANVSAKRRYARLKDTPAYKAMQFARNQVARIKQQAIAFVKSKRSHEYLGCSYEQAAKHIEAQLPNGWTWANYGDAWEIDHIVRLSDGSLLDPEHLRRVCHYTNLRPLAVSLNRSRAKGAWRGRQYAAA